MGDLVQDYKIRSSTTTFDPQKYFSIEAGLMGNLPFDRKRVILQNSPSFSF